MELPAYLPLLKNPRQNEDTSMYAYSQKQDRNTTSQFYHANDCNIISELR